MNHILGVIGPWQLLVVVLFFGGIIVGIVAIFSSRAKHKARAETLDQIQNKNRGLSEVEGKVSNSIEQLERLNKLRESGALTEAEFEVEKKKILE
jgi:hypothetical protein